MQHNRKRTEITIETETRIQLRRRSGAVRATCQQCLTERVMVSPSAAAALAGVSTRVIYRRIESGRLHFSETDGQLLICSESLLHIE
jgi:hypothetical protein